MENTEEIRKIEIDQKTLKNINATRKWTMFLSVIGFIILGLFIVLGLIAGTFLSAFKPGETGTGFPESLMFVIFLLLAVAYFFPVFFLFRFSKHAANAVHAFDKHELHKAFRSLKHYFAYLGVLIIIGLTLYVVVLIAAGSTLPFINGIGQ
jgi:protein-S-isoprenylcysteine O-methyltransferase Ste14